MLHTMVVAGVLFDFRREDRVARELVRLRTEIQKIS